MWEGEQSHASRPFLEIDRARRWIFYRRVLVLLLVLADAAAAGLAAVHGVEICFCGCELWIQAECFFPRLLGFVETLQIVERHALRIVETRVGRIFRESCIRCE